MARACSTRVRHGLAGRRARGARRPRGRDRPRHRRSWRSPSSAAAAVAARIQFRSRRHARRVARHVRPRRRDGLADSLRAAEMCGVGRRWRRARAVAAVHRGAAHAVARGDARGRPTGSAARGGRRRSSRWTRRAAAGLARRLGPRWTLAETSRIASGFYTSQAVVLLSRRPRAPSRMRFTVGRLPYRVLDQTRSSASSISKRRTSTSTPTWILARRRGRSGRLRCSSPTCRRASSSA